MFITIKNYIYKIHFDVIITVQSFSSFCFFQPLQIKSVIAKESLKGYIYIEAYKQTHVKQAIEGIGNLRIGLWQQMVCIKS